MSTLPAVTTGLPPKPVTLHAMRVFLADYADENPRTSLDERLDAAAEWADAALRFQGPLAPIELIDGPVLRWVLGLVAEELWPQLVRAWRAHREDRQENADENKAARKAAQAARHEARVLGAKPKTSSAKRSRPVRDPDGRESAVSFVESGGPIALNGTLHDGE